VSPLREGDAPAQGVERSHLVRGAAPREVYDVVVDCPGYPRLFPEIRNVRVVGPTPTGGLAVEFRAQVVLAVRYVLDMRCDPDGLAVTWTFIEGEVVSDSTGAWSFSAEGGDTRVTYRAALAIQAPLPKFMVRKATDALVSASLPSMFAALDREVARRRTERGGA
jgi:ribosome-associated toxin RatA of RatAB toxin-antitoxin module